MSAPVAVASIELSEEQRRRIAAELGLGADQLDAVPTTLGVAKYEVTDEAGDEVGGFSFNPAGMTFSPVSVTPDGVTHTQHGGRWSELGGEDRQEPRLHPRPRVSGGPNPGVRCSA